MKQVHADRLVTLGMELKTVPPEKFDLVSWADHDGMIDEADQKILGVDLVKHGEQELIITKEKLNLSCGTTACALGWAASIPEFQKLGLRLVMPVDVYKHDVDEVQIEVEPAYSFIVFTELTPSGKKKKNSETLYDFEAGEVFFGLGVDEADFLFNPERYDEARETGDVVNKIIEILQDYKYAAQAKRLQEFKGGREVKWKNQYGQGSTWVVPANKKK